ncbi:MAG: peptidylprolyl isomerase [Methanomicrobium sp.]|nr:peptidylprolyl isomerase [Methanomicrobium sp.]
MTKSIYVIFIAALIVLTAIAAGCTSTQTNAGGNAGAQTPAQTQTPVQTAAPADPNAVAKEGSTVSVYYVGTLDDGTVFDKKVKGTDTPLTFVVGSGSVIKGFDNAVIGMKAGETTKVHLTPDMAYGEYTPQLLQEFDKSAFGSEADTLNINDTVYITTPNGVFPAKIHDIGKNSITLDLNHRLAGQNLNFEITVDSVN